MLATITALLGASLALAQDTAPDTAREGVDPAVTITERSGGLIQEYGVGKNVYMIKVQPQNAPPYYLVDPDGSGSFEWRRDGPVRAARPPQWTLFRW